MLIRPDTCSIIPLFITADSRFRTEPWTCALTTALLHEHARFRLCPATHSPQGLLITRKWAVVRISTLTPEGSWNH
jgi:hypothetical protein